MPEICLTGSGWSGFLAEARHESIVRLQRIFTGKGGCVPALPGIRPRVGTRGLTGCGKRGEHQTKAPARHTSGGFA
jgi:hypothetical protein